MKGYLRFVEDFIRRNLFQRKIDKRYFFLLLTYIGGFALLFSGTIQAASPLGTWTLGDPETVGNGTQYTFTIDCPGLEVKGGTLLIEVPDGHADTDRLPTVILHAGGGGRRILPTGCPLDILKKVFAP